MIRSWMIKTTSKTDFLSSVIPLTILSSESVQKFQSVQLFEIVAFMTQRFFFICLTFPTTQQSLNSSSNRKSSSVNFYFSILQAHDQVDGKMKRNQPNGLYAGRKNPWGYQSRMMKNLPCKDWKWFQTRETMRSSQKKGIYYC